MLLMIKYYLQSKRRAQLNEMAVLFDLDPSVLKAMLAYWIRKGDVICHEEPACFVQCGQCNSLAYEWIVKVCDDKLSS